MDVPIENKKSKYQNTFYIIGAIIILSVIAYFILFFRYKSVLYIPKERVIIVEIAKGAFQEDIPINGQVRPLKTIYLDALEGGIVEEIFIEDGAILKKGESIIRLSNNDLELSLINQETAVYNLFTQIQISQNAARQNTITRENYKRDVQNAYIEANRVYLLNKELYLEDVIPKQDLIVSENNLNFQKQRLKAANKTLTEDSIFSRQTIKQSNNSYRRTKKALKLMKDKVEFLEVRAPFGGQLTALDVEIGESINKGSRLGQLDLLNGFKVRANIDEHYISRIYSGQQGYFYFNDIKFGLIIKKVFTLVENGKFQVDMIFQNIPNGIIRGQTLQIRLALSDQQLALLLPKGLFFQLTGGNWIYKLSEDGKKAFISEIKIGRQNTEYYEVLNGLETGDKVIISGYDNFGEIQELIFK